MTVVSQNYERLPVLSSPENPRGLFRGVFLDAVVYYINPEALKHLLLTDKSHFSLFRDDRVIQVLLKCVKMAHCQLLGMISKNIKEVVLTRDDCVHEKISVISTLTALESLTIVGSGTTRYFHRMMPVVCFPSSLTYLKLDIRASQSPSLEDWQKELEKCTKKCYNIKCYITSLSILPAQVSNLVHLSMPDSMFSCKSLAGVNPGLKTLVMKTVYVYELKNITGHFNQITQIRDTDDTFIAEEGKPYIDDSKKELQLLGITVVSNMDFLIDRDFFIGKIERFTNLAVLRLSSSSLKDRLKDGLIVMFLRNFRLKVLDVSKLRISQQAYGAFAFLTTLEKLALPCSDKMPKQTLRNIAEGCSLKVLRLLGQIPIEELSGFTHLTGLSIVCDSFPTQNIESLPRSITHLTLEVGKEGHCNLTFGACYPHLTNLRSLNVKSRSL